MKNSVYAILVFCLLGLITLNVGCSDDSDTTKPVVKLNQPTDGAVLLIGSESGFLLDVDFEDNEELSSYKVDIHNNFNNHEHTRSEENHGDAFSFNKTWPLSGKSAHVSHREIVIPAGVTAGNYHLLVFCTDKEGNETFVARKIVLSEE